MRTLSTALTVVLLVCGCADPRAPTGGPADKTPPALANSVPVNEAVNVNPTVIRFTFTEYVNQASFEQAFSITPAVEGRLRFKWRRRTVSFQLPETLRDSTTYLISLGTRLRDAQGVSLRHPITIAFATGPIIDQGRLRGRLVEPVSGEPVSGYDVYAYRTNELSQGWPESPAYRTQTGEDGVFDLSYVREGEYFVLALRDENRNRRPDARERFATPPELAISAIPDTTAPLRQWVVSRQDSIPPSIDRVRALSEHRVAVRFSEPVVMPAPTPEAWVLTDSTNAKEIAVQAVYSFERDPRSIYLLTDALDERTYTLTPDAQLTDSSGNALTINPIYFAGRSRVDTAQVRFIGFMPADRYDLGPRDVPGLIFSQAVSDSLFATLVSAADTAGNMFPLAYTTHNGTLYRLSLSLSPGESATVQVVQPDSTYEVRFRRITDRELGALSGIASPAGDSIVVALRRAEESQYLARVQPDSTGAFVFEDLPEGAFRLSVFADRNGNGKWDGGQLLPFVPAEPISWHSEAVLTRARWDTALADTLYVFPKVDVARDTTAR